MGKNKLKKFAALETYPHVLQYSYALLQDEGFPLRGRWKTDFFHNDHPIVLELGCGKGEYTVGLARKNPDRNYIGVDVKGARIYTGATMALEEKMTNVAFLRASISDILSFFAPGEVSEIWITFPDPQMQYTRRRLTSPRFLEMYRNILAPDALIRLKTDSPFLYTYTRNLILHNSMPLSADSSDLYADCNPDLPASLREIRTFYEQQWLARGKTIKYLAFRLPAHEVEHIDEDDIERDDYHAVSRGNFHETPSK